MVKVLVPDVPAAHEIAKYLRRIDAAKWYSNRGPLALELERRMGGVTVSSATTGLELVAPMVFRKRVRIPAFTFAATATALLRAGLEPVLCDVGDDWSLVDPDQDSLNVCPFGAPVLGGGLIDAAAAWGNQKTGIRVFSLHATKSLPAGEGGLVVGPPELMARVVSLSNFGLQITPFAHGIVSEAGTNAKLSEYHAAVALAALDRWQETAVWRIRLDADYRERLVDQRLQPRPAGVYTTFPIRVRNAEAIARDMASRGIETRRWYTPTLERHPAFKHLKVEGDLRMTKALNDEVLCLPFHREVPVDQVCEVLRWAITRNDKGRSSTRRQTSSENILNSALEHGLTPSSP